MKRVAVVLSFVLASAMFTGCVEAHEVRPAYLELRQTAPKPTTSCSRFLRSGKSCGSRFT